jgi:hypothetical protein
LSTEKDYLAQQQIYNEESEDSYPSSTPQQRNDKNYFNREFLNDPLLNKKIRKIV